MSDLAESRTSLLFKPFDLHNLVLPNRIVMAPMTRSKSPGGIPGPARDRVWQATRDPATSIPYAKRTPSSGSAQSIGMCDEELRLFRSIAAEDLTDPGEVLASMQSCANHSRHA